MRKVTQRRVWAMAHLPVRDIDHYGYEFTIGPLTMHGRYRSDDVPEQITLRETGELRAERMPRPEQRHETVRLFEPAPDQMPGQTSLEL